MQAQEHPLILLLLFVLLQSGLRVTKIDISTNFGLVTIDCGLSKDSVV